MNVEDDQQPAIYAPAPGCRLQTVVVQRPRCPVCNSPKLSGSGGSIEGGDGSLTRYTRCTECGHRFKLLLE